MSRLVLPPHLQREVAIREQAEAARGDDERRAFVEGFVDAHAKSSGLSWDAAADNLLRRAPDDRREKIRRAIDILRTERTGGRTLVRVKIARGPADDGPIEWGEVKVRPLIDLDNQILCTQFGFDSDHYVFDLPTSAGGGGSSIVGAGGGRGSREVNGFVFRKGADGKPDRNEHPIAVVDFLRDGKQGTERDADPTDRADFERLG